MKINQETFGLGPVRSLKEYELYAGIDFRTRRVHKNTIEEMEPPVPIDNYEENLLNYKKYCIDLYKKSVPESDYDFWVIAFEDDAGVEIYREDADAKEVERILQQDKQNPFAQIWRKFYVQQEAKTWIIWPHSISKGWCERLTGLLGTP